ncbi:MAG: glycosyltransferase [Mastigocoleus sp. MO_167.B18]|nr:glycosyltransferase [Mastigocoleus sp. MO_167.B18]
MNKTNKTKICITTIEYPPDVGGVGESVNRIAKMLTNSGYEVHIAVFRSSNRSVPNVIYRRAGYETTVQNNIFVHRIQSSIHSSVTELSYLSDIYFQLKLLYQKYQYDLFHAFFLIETGYVTTMIAKENDVPVINSVRGSDLHKHIFSPKNHGPISWVLENSDWTTFVSRTLQKRASLIAPSSKSKSTAFWNSIAPINFEELPKPAKLNELPGLVIGTTGRFRGKKGIEFLLDACSKLSQEIELTLLLVGDFIEKEKSYWEQEVKNNDLGSRLQITGMNTRQETLAYLPHLDIFAIPSLTDGCPNALLEAMSAGCAIVGSNADAIGEIIEDGVSGLLVNPANSTELATALRYLANQPELRKQLGRSAKIKAQTELAPAIELDNWLSIYQRVLNTSNVIQIPELQAV